MNSNEDNKNSLCKTLEQIISPNYCCPSIQYLIHTVKDYDAIMNDLEKRLQHIQQEIKYLQLN